MKVLGLKKFVDKKNISRCIISVSLPFNDYDIQNGAVGSDVKQLWLNGSAGDNVDKSIIGKDIEPVATFNNGQWYTSGIKVL